MLFRFAAGVAICVAVAMTLTAGSTSLGHIGLSFGICVVYSVCVGGLAYPTL
jgi:hypothetical protein